LESRDRSLICVDTSTGVRDVNRAVDPRGRQHRVAQRKGRALVHLGDHHRLRHRRRAKSWIRPKL
jgi:hypothetical protein